MTHENYPQYAYDPEEWEYDDDFSAWNESQLDRSETAYQDLKQAIQWTDGFAVFVIRCADNEQFAIFRRLQRDLPQFRLDSVTISPQTPTDFNQKLATLQQSDDVNAVFISGIEEKFSTYLKLLDSQRELLYQGVPFCLIFFSREWWCNDWKFTSLGWEIPQQGFPELLGDYCDYCDWTEVAKLDRITRIQTFLTENQPELPLRLSLLWDQGKLLYAQGDYPAALVVYQELLRHQPRQLEVMKHEGYALHQIGRFDEAIAAFDRVLQSNPQEAQAWWNRGWALSKLGQSEQAIAAFDQALQYQPDHLWSWLQRGDAWAQLQQYEAAIVSYDQALKISPSYRFAWAHRGIALFHLGRYIEAIAAYDKALKIETDAQIWKNRGYAYRRLQLPEGEILSYQAALELEPDDYATTNLLVNLFWRLARYEAAIATLRQFLQFSPEHDVAWAKLGYCLAQLEQDEEAILAYQKAIQYAQESSDRVSRQGKILYQCNQLIAAQPHNARAFYYRACLYAELGETSRTVDDLSMAIQLDPDKYRQLNIWANLKISATMIKKRGKIRSN